MATQRREFDITLRPIVARWPADFLRLAVDRPIERFQVLDPNLPASERVADWVALVEEPAEARCWFTLSFRPNIGGKSASGC